MTENSVPIIEVHDLVRAFGDFRAVDQISFSVSPGTVFAFLGPNGAGKTTTIKMLTTILRPTSGSIRVNGADPALDPNAVRRSIGIGFQDPSLDDQLTAAENMDFHGAIYGVPRAARRQRTEKLLRFVELWDRRADLVKKFSGGMKRRLEIARALLHQPRIVFLDEPTVGLDPQTRNRIWTYLKQLNAQENVTVFFTTHYMEEAERVSDDVAIVDRGKIIARGAPDALKKQTGKNSLEDAFISLTGHDIREEDASPQELMRSRGRLWGRR
jgi:ABC-2 type transport system ATP-binding protein